jgi:hypothetical protein
LRGARVGHR